MATLGKELSLTQHNYEHQVLNIPAENESHIEQLSRFLATIDVQGDFRLEFGLEGQTGNGRLEMRVEIRQKQTSESIAKAFGVGKDEKRAKNRAALRLLEKLRDLHGRQAEELGKTPKNRKKRRIIPSETEEDSGEIVVYNLKDMRSKREDELAELREKNGQIEKCLEEKKSKLAQQNVEFFDVRKENVVLAAENERLKSQLGHFQTVNGELVEKNRQLSDENEKFNEVMNFCTEVQNLRENLSEKERKCAEFEAELRASTETIEKLRRDCECYLFASNRYLIWMSEYEHFIKTALFREQKEAVETYLLSVKHWSKQVAPHEQIEFENNVPEKLRNDPTNPSPKFPLQNFSESAVQMEKNREKSVQNDLIRVVKERDEKQKSLDKVRKKLEQREREIEKLENKVASERENGEELREKLHKWDIIAAEFEETTDLLQGKLSKSKMELKEKQQTCDKLREELNTLEEENQAVSSSTVITENVEENRHFRPCTPQNSLLEENKKLKEENIELGDRLAEMVKRHEKTITSATTEMDTLKKQLNDACSAAVKSFTVDSQLNQANKEMCRLTNKLGNLAAEKATLLQQLAENQQFRERDKTGCAHMTHQLALVGQQQSAGVSLPLTPSTSSPLEQSTVSQEITFAQAGLTNPYVPPY